MASETVPMTSRDPASEQASTMGSLGFLLLGFPLALTWFVLLVTLWAVSIGTAVLWAGLPIAAVTIPLTTGIGRLERARANALLGTRIEQPAAAHGLRAKLLDPRTWRDLAHVLVLFPLATVEFAVVVSLWAAGLNYFAVPFYYWALPGGVWTFPTIGDGPHWFAVRSFSEGLPWLALGTLLLALAVLVTRRIGIWHARFARSMLTVSGSIGASGTSIGEAEMTQQAPRRLPRAIRSVGFMLLNLPFRLTMFVLLVVGVVAGTGLAIVWVGLPILMVTFALNEKLATIDRRWIASWLGVHIEPAARKTSDGGAFRRLATRLTDAVTWRSLGYQLLCLPLSCFEFAFGLASIVLTPMAIWVAPTAAWLHASLAKVCLGPTSTTELRAKAEHLQASRARGVDAAEAERRRIERDLHDGAQQRLVSVAMGLGRARNKLAEDPDAAGALIEEAHADAKLAVSELRDLARGIYPAVLGDRGLDAALSALAARCPVPVHVSVEVDPRPPTAVESCAYFLVGEALTNLAKHAEASSAQVRVQRDADTVVVEVTDDGKGGAVLAEGGGLAGLADRAASIDGVVTVFSPLGGPTVVRADLPCAR